MWVGGGVEPSSGDLGSKPVGFGEADNEWSEVGLDLVLGELVADLVQRLNSLREKSARTRDMPASNVNAAYLVSDERLLNGGQVLQRAEQDMAVLRTADILDEVA